MSEKMLDFLNTPDTPKNKWDRFLRVVSDPNILDEICIHISNGGTLITLAELWNVRFGDLTNWLHNDKVRSDRYMKALSDRAEFAIERVLQELRRIGLADPRKIYKDDGTIRPVSEWDADTASTVASVEVFEQYEGKGDDRQFTGFVKKIKFNDKMKALEMLGKNLNILIENVRHTGTVKLEDLVFGTKEE